MKLFIHALCCFALIASPAHAFWIARPIHQRVVESDCIAVATLDGFVTISKSDLIEEQHARFTLVHLVKGQLPPTFLVQGAKTTMCVPFVDFSYLEKGTYLIFLSAAGSDGVRFPLDASVLQVTGGKLMWTDSNGTAAQERTLQYVERTIRSIAKSSPSQRAKFRS